MVKVGSSMREGAINVSSYSGYQKFTVNNFVFKNVDVDLEGGWANRVFSQSYDASTGIYTFTLPCHPTTPWPDQHVTGYAKADVYLLLD